MNIADECWIQFWQPCENASDLYVSVSKIRYSGYLEDSSFYNIGDNEVLVRSLETGLVVGTLFTPDPDDSLEPQCDNFYFGDPDGRQCAVDAFEAVWQGQGACLNPPDGECDVCECHVDKVYGNVDERCEDDGQVPADPTPATGQNPR